MAELLNPSEIFATAFEPKVKNRFILDVDGIPSFIIKKFTFNIKLMHFLCM